jgi:hypothetical protein
MKIQEKLTAEQYRALAKEAYERRIESFDRCDTDGFLSQWAQQIVESQYEKLAWLADNDFKYTFETLVDMDGNLVPCREIETKFGFAYGVYGSFQDAQNCGEIIKWVGITHRAAKNKGYAIALVRSEATVEVGKGYAGNTYFAPVAKVFSPENCEIVKVGA